MYPLFTRVLLLLLLTFLVAGCTRMSSSSQLSPDREPAAPRYGLAADTVVRPDTLKN